MQVFIYTQKGSTFAVDVKANDTIKDVKSKIQEIEGIPSDQQILHYITIIKKRNVPTLNIRGDELDDNQTLDECHIPNNSKLCLFGKFLHFIFCFFN